MNDFDNALALVMEQEETVMKKPARKLEVVVMSLEDLPEVGAHDTTYEVTSTNDCYRYINGAWANYNPYAPEEEIKSPGSEVIVDDTAYMLHGGTGVLSVIYNVRAFIEDQRVMKMRGWSYYDMLPRGILARSDTLEQQRDKYFRNSHRTLLTQLREVLRPSIMDKAVEARERTRVELCTKLEAMGIQVWVTEGIFGFKYGDFVTRF